MRTPRRWSPPLHQSPPTTARQCRLRPAGFSRTSHRRRRTAHRPSGRRRHTVPSHRTTPAEGSRRSCTPTAARRWSPTAGGHGWEFLSSVPSGLRPQTLGPRVCLQLAVAFPAAAARLPRAARTVPQAASLARMHSGFERALRPRRHRPPRPPVEPRRHRSSARTRHVGRRGFCMRPCRLCSAVRTRPVGRRCPRRLRARLRALCVAVHGASGSTVVRRPPAPCLL